MFLISVCTILVLFVAYQGVLSQKEIVDINGQTRIVTSTWVLIAFAAILIITSTLRYGFVDTYAYKDLYRMVRNTPYYIENAPWGVEAGWMRLMYYLNYISPSPKLMLFMVAFAINTAFLVLSKKYSYNPLFSFFIYFCMMFMDTNNGIRQMFATALVMFAFPLLTRKKYIVI